MKAWHHLKTILHHKRLVRAGCFKVGLYRQGIMHDWSKYSPTEFLVGCKYYQGNMSPNNAERAARGYSSSWLHHKGRNKHHMEYWIDYSVDKNYQKGAYTDRSPLEYYENGKSIHILHPNTRELLERLLTMLAEEGEEATYKYIRREVLKNKK